MRGAMRTGVLVAAAVASAMGAPPDRLHAQPSDPVAALVDGAMPASVTGGLAPVTPANTRRDPDTGLIDVLLTPDPSMRPRSIVDPEAEDVVAGMLRRLWARGTASGLAGVLYDNRDSGHSVLDHTRFPQLARTEYDEALKRQGLHHGVAGRVRFPLPVVGNSSTALTHGPLARSLGRLAVNDQAAALRSYRLFVSNHLYVYPEHRDYDLETGDRLLGNVPYFLLSSGSSRSDLPFIYVALAIIAALPPETRAAAEESGRLAATVQAVMRRTLTGVNTAADYLSLAAHRPVLGAKRLRSPMAVNFANSLTPETLPPLVSLRVEQDLAARPGVDYLAENIGEVLYTTPMAVARAWRSFAYERTVTLRAAASPEPQNPDDIRFHWVLLQGDPSRVTIRPRSDAGHVADIDIAWHDRFAVAADSAFTAPRIDIAVIAEAGGVMSAPAIFSVLFPVHQAREYRADASGQPVLARLAYKVSTRSQDYADPSVWPDAPWEDELLRDDDGQVRELQRTHHGGRRESLMRTTGGWVSDGVPVRHFAQTGDTGVLELRAVP